MKTTDDHKTSFIKRAKKLRRKGYKYIAIAAELNASIATVWRAVNHQNDQ